MVAKKKAVAGNSSSGTSCGYTGMSMQSVKLIKPHTKGNGDVSIYSEVSNFASCRPAEMNLAIRDIDTQIAPGDSFLKDRHSDLKADYVLVTPPFNDGDWRNELLKHGQRWAYDTQPAGNANYAWRVAV